MHGERSAPGASWSGPRTRRTHGGWWGHVIGLGMMVVSLLIIFTPIIVLATCSHIAEVYDCDLGEESRHTCVVEGFEVGALLENVGFFSGWLGIFGVFGGGMLFVASALVYGIVLFHEWRRRR